MLTAAAVTGMGSRRLGMILGIPSVLLTMGVVYTQMHFAMDALAGVMVAGAVVALVVVAGSE